MSYRVERLMWGALAVGALHALVLAVYSLIMANTRVDDMQWNYEACKARQAWDIKQAKEGAK